MKAPYCIIDDVKALPLTDDPHEAARLRQRIAASVGDLDALRRICGEDPDVFTDFYGDDHAPELSTEDTIDSFLDRFAPKAGLQQDPLQFAPAVDYATMLELEEQQNESKTAETENSKMSAGEDAEKHISNAENASLTSGSQQEIEPDNPPKQAEDTSLSESFAQILIKNRNYSKALEIISQLSLANPEKSVYFADQIRFLRKAVYNVNKSKH